MDSLARRKAALRARMRQMRVAIPPEERATSAERVMSRLFDVPALRIARTVLSFSSFGSEVPTEEIVRRLRDEDRRVLLPFVEGHDMEAAEASADDSLVATEYGPMEPTVRVAVHPSEVDVVLVPALAFDRLGYRVGYGGGHYDRYLARLGPRAVRVGIAFHAQLVPAVPHGVEDEPVDVLVTEAETVDCRTERRVSKPSGE
jgi:5-formyltetrahydrofolate cyclo-ligase